MANQSSKLTEIFLWFFSLFITIVFGLNIRYYNEVYNAGGNGGISSNTAYQLLVTNVIFFVVALLYLIYRFFVLFTTYDFRQETKQKFTEWNQEGWKGLVGPNGEFSKKKSTTEYTPWFGNKGVFLRGNNGITNKTQNMNVNMDLAKPLATAYETGKATQFGIPVNANL
jgi:hypothetical protein